MGGLRLKFWASQIGHCVAFASPLLQRICAAQAQRRGDGRRKPITRLGVTTRYSKYNERCDLI